MSNGTYVKLIACCDRLSQAPMQEHLAPVTVFPSPLEQVEHRHNLTTILQRQFDMQQVPQLLRK